MQEIKIKFCELHVCMIFVIVFVIYVFFDFLLQRYKTKSPFKHLIELSNIQNK